MSFTNAVKTILASAIEPMTLQEIREAIKQHYPQYYGTPSHQRCVDKKQCINLDHALLSQIYSLIRTNSSFFTDSTCKPKKISLIDTYKVLEDQNKTVIKVPVKPGQSTERNRKSDKVEPKRPTSALISGYLHEWGRLENYKLQEASLGLLFHELCPENNTIEHILLKVSALNDFYSTNIFDTFTVASHILSHNIDAHLQNNNHDIVNTIAAVSIKGKLKNFYSFASKYCSHHKPDSFPIYDFFVEKMLLYYRKQDRFYDFEQTDLKNYRCFIQIINGFQYFYGLEEFSLRQIDIFLWLAGKEFFPKKYK